MKPAPFEYVKAVSVADASAVLAEHGGEARVLAGGQSLMPLLGMRLMRPALLVDVNGLGDELGGIALRDGSLRVGALVRYSEVEHDPLVAEHVPLLAHVVRYVGDRQVRNRGTVGGALAQADPTGEVALACLALGARVHARSVEGTREIPIEDFFLGPYTTSLRPDELVTDIALPLSAGPFGFFERGRKHNDFAVVSIAVVASPDGGVWRGVRIALGGVNDTPVLATGAASALEDRAWDAETLELAVGRALTAIDPPDDVRASSEYRRHLVAVHLRRVLGAMAAEALGD